MVKGLYTGTSGMIAQQHRLNTVANNLANVDKPGFKRDVTCLKSFPEMRLARTEDDGVMIFPLGSTDSRPYIGRLGTGVEVNEVYTQFEQGSLKETGNAFDFALNGKGFIAVETPNGERYTRNGSFLLDEEGFLTTKDGYKVLGENGPMKLKANNFILRKDGSVFVNSEFEGDDKRLVQMRENDYSASALLDRMKIVRFDNERFIKKEGESLYVDTSVSGDAYIAEGFMRPEIKQGFIETSNVNAVREMVNMIEVQRAYEMNSQVIKTEDTLIGKAVNEVGRYI